jgi:hypothetical protein
VFHEPGTLGVVRRSPTEPCRMPVTVVALQAHLYQLNIRPRFGSLMTTVGRGRAQRRIAGMAEEEMNIGNAPSSFHGGLSRTRLQELQLLLIVLVESKGL